MRQESLESPNIRTFGGVYPPTIRPGACPGVECEEWKEVFCFNLKWFCEVLGKEFCMKALKERIHSFMVSEDGPTATEYAVMLALIIIVALGAVSLLGNKVKDIFTSTTNTIESATTPAS
jgi:pilus assembly protein Flp/PilA